MFFGWGEVWGLEAIILVVGLEKGQRWDRKISLPRCSEHRLQTHKVYPGPGWNSLTWRRKLSSSSDLVSLLLHDCIKMKWNNQKENMSSPRTLSCELASCKEELWLIFLPRVLGMTHVHYSSLLPTSPFSKGFLLFGTFLPMLLTVSVCLQLSS